MINREKISFKTDIYPLFFPLGLVLLISLVLGVYRKMFFGASIFYPIFFCLFLCGMILATSENKIVSNFGIGLALAMIGSGLFLTVMGGQNV